MRIAYFRVSSDTQSIEAQRHAMKQTGAAWEREFSDEGVSGAVPAMQRPGFAALAAFARAGDTVVVSKLDRLGRDTIDVQLTVKALREKGVEIEAGDLPGLTGPVGDLVLMVVSKLAEMERTRISERCAAGRELAKQALASTGKTHRGKVSMGRPQAFDLSAIAAWRAANSASIAQTAAHFGCGAGTVKRACASAAGAPTNG